MDTTTIRERYTSREAVVAAPDAQLQQDFTVALAYPHTTFISSYVVMWMISEVHWRGFEASSPSVESSPAW